MIRRLLHRTFGWFEHRWVSHWGAFEAGPGVAWWQCGDCGEATKQPWTPTTPLQPRRSDGTFHGPIHLRPPLTMETP